MFRTALELAARHIIKRLGNKRPVFVALQGPQGSGKTFLAAQLQARLQSPPCSLQIAVLSIDDLYLPHRDLVSLAASDNVLWKGRGLPGTHDLNLGSKVLSNLASGDRTIELPRFDKSLFNGEGDRLPMDGTGPNITPPVDVVILEGWLVGFHPITSDDLMLRWNGVWKDEGQKLGLSEAVSGRLSDIQAINEKLNEYLPLWNFFDVLIQLKALPPSSPEMSQYEIVYKWRMEQEHYMKETNGGNGMSDAAVKVFVVKCNYMIWPKPDSLSNRFVDRYIPGYVFFGDLQASASNQRQWSGNGLALCLDDSREVVNVETF